MDSKQAATVLIDPLIAPEPSEETGLNASFARSPASPRSSPAARSSNNPFRDRASSISKDGAFTHVRQTSRGSSLGSPSSPRSSKFPTYHEHALGQRNNEPGESSRGSPAYDDSPGRPRRSSSLKERFPGDKSTQPLEILRRDSKKASRSSHLRKGNIPGADIIDKLDMMPNNVPYHHEGPFDAALMARNRDSKSSPIAALAETNREALKATAPENIKDALEQHRPLDGVAVVPPGVPDRMGRRLDYEEGDNELIEGVDKAGGPHRWPGVDYDKKDQHGQGNPSYSLDRALQKHTIHERDFDGDRGIEMSNRPRDRKSMDTRDPVEIVGGEAQYSDLQYAADVDAHPIQRKGSLKAGLKKRIGSIRKKGLDEFLP